MRVTGHASLFALYFRWIFNSNRRLTWLKIINIASLVWVTKARLLKPLFMQLLCAFCSLVGTCMYN